MNIFSKNSFLKKIAITILTVTLLQIFVIKPVQAVQSEDVVEGGGKLLKPVFSLLITMGDGVMNILHSSIMGVDTPLIKIETGENEIWQSILKVIRVVIATVGCIVLFVSGNFVLAVVIGAFILSSVASSLRIPGVSFLVSAADAFENAVVTMWDETQLPSELYLPAYSYTPEEIFKGNILLFNVNFFNRNQSDLKIRFEDDTEVFAKDYKNEEDLQKQIEKHGGNVKKFFYEKNGEEITTSRSDSVLILQETISKWYNALRNICLVLMLSVLVYIGIRMILSSVASDKAKYLTMLKDWFVGICLLFLMHYIMAFSVTIVEKITDVVSTAADKDLYIGALPWTDKIEEDLDKGLGREKELRLKEDDKKQGYGWPTNLMGYLRLQAQMNTYGWEFVGHAIMFIMLVCFTVVFTITYLKRLLYMAFLTLISPMVALTYCIDKVNDGQAQGFNRWLKEYIFNLLIQPMHLLLYYILVTTAFKTVGTNFVYSIVAIGFMIPAEKLLRSFFGFEKAHTPPAIGPGATMMAATGLTSLLNRGKALGSKARGGSGSNGNSNDSAELPSSQRTLFQADFDEIENNDAGNNDAGNNDAGNDDAGNDDAGNDDAGNDDAGNVNIDDDARNEQDGEEQQTQRQVETPETEDRNAEETRERPEHEPRRFFSRVPISRKVKRRAKALGAVAASRTKRALRNAPNTLVKGIRTASGVAFGALAAGAGVAMAATTGDPNNVWKVGAGAAVAGYAAGSSLPDRVTNVVDDIKNDPTFDAAYNQGEYKEDARRDQIKKFKKSEEYEKICNNLKAAYGKDESKRIIKDGELDQYLDNGISDIKAIRAMHDLQRDNGGLSYIDSTEKAIDVYNAGQLIGNTKNMTKKKQDEHTDTFREKAKERGMNQENANQFAENQMNAIKQLHDKMYNYNTK